MRGLLLLAMIQGGEPAPGGKAALVWADGSFDAKLAHEARREVAAELRMDPSDIALDGAEVAAWQRAFAIAPSDAMAWETIERELATAERQYRQGDFESARAGALFVLRRVREEVPHLPLAFRAAFAAQVLLARIELAEGHEGACDAALRRAWALDPTAQLSAREFPPGIVARFNAHRQRGQEEPREWIDPSTLWGGVLPVDVFVEVDGLPLADRIPTGEHQVIFRSPRAGPIGAMLSTDARPWQLPDSATATMSQGEVVRRGCEAGLERLFVVRHLGVPGRLELSLRGCVSGTPETAPWRGAESELGDGVRQVLGRPRRSGGSIARDLTSRGGTMRRDAKPTKPERRWRTWMWSSLGALVAAGLAIGIGVGVTASERSPGARIEGEGFRAHDGALPERFPEALERVGR